MERRYKELMTRRTGVLTLIFDLLLKKDIIGSSSLEGMSEIFRNDHIHHIHKLDVDTILVKSSVEIVH
jgi:hypothetical protein